MGDLGSNAKFSEEYSGSKVRGFEVGAKSAVQIAQTRNFQEEDAFDCTAAVSMRWNNCTKSAQVSIKSIDCGLVISGTLSFENYVTSVIDNRMPCIPALLGTATSCPSSSLLA